MDALSKLESIHDKWAKVLEERQREEHEVRSLLHTLQDELTGMVLNSEEFKRYVAARHLSSPTEAFFHLRFDNPHYNANHHEGPKKNALKAA